MAEKMRQGTHTTSDTYPTFLVFVHQADVHDYSDVDAALDLATLIFWLVDLFELLMPQRVRMHFNVASAVQEFQSFIIQSLKLKRAYMITVITKFCSFYIVSLVDTTVPLPMIDKFRMTTY